MKNFSKFQEESRMNTFTKFFKIIAIVAIIAVSFNACSALTSALKSSSRSSAEKDLLKNMESATWQAKALKKEPALDKAKKLSNKNVEYDFFSTFEEKEEAPKLDPNTWYELTAPQLSGLTYYCYKKVGEKETVLDLYELDEETLRLRKVYQDAKWQVKEIPINPFTHDVKRSVNIAGAGSVEIETKKVINGLPALPRQGVSRLDVEVDFFTTFEQREGAPKMDKGYYEITAPEFPNTIYIYTRYVVYKIASKDMSSINSYSDFIKTLFTSTWQIKEVKNQPTGVAPTGAKVAKSSNPTQGVAGLGTVTIGNSIVGGTEWVDVIFARDVIEKYRWSYKIEPNTWYEITASGLPGAAYYTEAKDTGGVSKGVKSGNVKPTSMYIKR